MNMQELKEKYFNGNLLNFEEFKVLLENYTPFKLNDLLRNKNLKFKYAAVIDPDNNFNINQLNYIKYINNVLCKAILTRG